MHNQPYVGRIALCTRKKLLKSGEIRHFYGMKRGGPTPFFPKISRKLDVWMGKMEKKVYQNRGKQVFVLTNWRFIIKILRI